MSAPFVVEVEFPHDWKNGFALGAYTMGEAEREAAEYARGNPGEKGYCKVRILSLVREVN